MKKIGYIFLICLLSLQLKAQLSSNSLNDETTARIFLKVGTAYNAVKYPDAIGAGVITFDFDLTNSAFEMGGWQSSWRWPSLGDVFIPAFGEIVGFTFRGKNTPGIDGNLGSTNLSSLLLGWHNNAWTFISSDYINIAGGFHFGDYAYGFKRYEGAEGRFFTKNALNFADDYTDPSGYYIGLGPAFIVDVALVGDLLFHYEGAYVFTGRILKEGSSVAPKNSPNPIFLNQQFELRYNHFFLGVEYCAAMKNNEAPHAGRRLAFITGVTLF